MKKTFITIACTAVVAAAIAIPFGVGNAPAPESAIQASVSPSATDSSSNANGISNATDSTIEESSTEQGAQDEQYEQGAILIGLQDGMTAADLNARLPELDYIATKQVAEDDVSYGYVKLRLAESVGVEYAEKRIAGENTDIIAAAQPNYIYHLQDNVTNTSTTASAAPSNTLVAGIVAEATAINDTYASKLWGLEAVNAYQAWDKATTEGDVTVAVLDTGIDPNHVDLVGRIVGYCDQQEESGPFSTGVDENGHGTHVSGIIAATANNKQGVAGVSYNANILSVKVLDRNGKGSSASLRNGIEYVIEQAKSKPIKVLNLSLGSEAETDNSDEDRAFLDAIEDLHDAGILVVYAAGNDATSITHAGNAYKNFPVDYDDDPGALGVINIGQNGSGYARDTSSNYNMAGQNTKDLSAPGMNICSTTPGNKYANSSGTSMAAPYVSGIAALVFAVNPSLSAEKVSEILCSTAQDLDTSNDGFDLQTGYGLVNAAAAVEEAFGRAGGRSSLSAASITVSPETCTFSGSACEPTVTVTLNGHELNKGSDFTVKYFNNVTVGTASISVKGIGNYLGMANQTFTIKRKSITPSISLSKTTFTYDGATKKPTVIVKDGSATIPVSNYSLSYVGNRTSVGTHAVVVSLKGNYTGSNTAYFTINPKGTNISKLTKLKRGFTVKWKKQATQTTGYQVQYSLKSNFSSKKTVTISKNKTLSKTVSKLKSKKKYYVRVRTYKSLGGTKYYSSWSAEKSVKTK